MKYDHIFWDWNGTLLDDVKVSYDAVNVMLSEKDKCPISFEDYLRFIDTPIINFYRRILPEDELDMSEISKHFRSYYADHSDENTVSKPAVDLLEKCRKNGVKQYILSAADIKDIKPYFDKYGLNGYFEYISAANNARAESKIDRAVKFFELNRNKIDRKKCLIIGDTVHDALAADRCGIEAVLYSKGHQDRKSLEMTKKRVFDSFGEIDDFLFS